MLDDNETGYIGDRTRVRNPWSDVIGSHEHRAVYDPNEGKTAKELAAQRRARAEAIKTAPEYFVPTERLVGRALVLLDAGPLPGADFLDQLGPVDPDQLEVLRPFVEARRMLRGAVLIDHIVYSVRESSAPIEDLRARLLGRTAA